MFERLLISAILIAAGGFGWFAFNRLALRRLAHSAPTDPALAELRPGIPAVLYFTTPLCEPCRTLQRPALNRLQSELGADHVQVVQIDASAQPADAERWGVFSAPTTFILDGSHTPRGVNRGVASFETLQRQIADVSSNRSGKPRLPAIGETA